MTLTLRPAGPEEPAPDGGRTRTYDICSNARPVGTVRLTASRPYGVVLGRIVRLAVDPAQRRRGRATAAALAAEEVLRDWRCVRVELALPEPALPAHAPPEPAAPALVLATALGYAERSRVMVKELTGPPPLPAGSLPREMTDAEYTTWRGRDVAGYSEVLADRGVPPERIRTVALGELDALLPHGPATSGMTLRTVEHDGVVVGGLWLRTDGAPRPEADAWAYALEVPTEHRGHGHGRTLMLLAERECHTAGPRRLGLQVRTDNAPARRLYATLGYRTIERVLHKRLD